MDYKIDINNLTKEDIMQIIKHGKSIANGAGLRTVTNDTEHIHKQELDYYDAVDFFRKLKV